MVDEDAIFTRTRARYSLAGCTLDELETFLQETDDDEDLKNVDDEEEYRKFLSACAHDRDGDGKLAQETENVDEEDENDADFLIEIEEALESDPDETVLAESCKPGTGSESVVLRKKWQTRQSSGRKSNVQPREDALEFPKRSVRPLVPIMPRAPVPPHPIPESNRGNVSSTSSDVQPNFFTPDLYRQLYSLIYEHTQLLIQVFVLCVVKPSRRDIASQTEEMITQIVHKRDEVLQSRKKLNPSSCPNHDQSAHNDSPVEAGPTSGNVDYLIKSVLDVPPLSLAGKFMEDLATAKEEYKQKFLEGTGDNWSGKEPLFPRPSVTCLNEASTESHLPSQAPPRKTLVSSLVENSKRKLVALVPKEIVKLAQRFIPLFNSSLYPSEPPPPAVASRVLFTETEDDLLALGLMKYNTDWKTIQQCLLPCKSVNQIYVRQKNRCSSKAPENCIKAVRRMKTAPLTDQEITQIREGLKCFKLDWMAVWKFVVPYRDPSLLRRQWRIALGIQKSYRRRPDAPNRRSRPADDEDDPQPSNDEDDSAGSSPLEPSYIHEAFLGDWRPDTPAPLHPPGFISVTLASHQRPPGGQIASDTSSAPHIHASFLEDWRPETRPVPTPPIDATENRRVAPPPLHLRVTRKRRKWFRQMVKLAPNLPPVNLPSSVRIITQSKFDACRQPPPPPPPQPPPPPLGGAAAAAAEAASSPSPVDSDSSFNIIFEQEELSDSEESIVFEHEELPDSDGDDT